jgi:hypothetical protein
MESSSKPSHFLAHANSLLLKYHKAAVRPNNFYLRPNLNATPPSYTLVLEPEDTVTLE